MNTINSSFRIKVNEETVYLPLLSFFCFTLLIVRMLYTNTFEYRFMGVNLMLAWLPYIFSLAIMKIQKGKRTIQQFILFFLWLIFFPNAAYMITDIYHLSEFQSMPMWYDLIMLLSFAWCGLLLGFYSLKKIHNRYVENNKPVFNIAVIFLFFFTCGIGIYFGRYARWNSWEIITQPANLFNQFFAIISNTYNLASMISIGILFGIFLTLIYVKLFSIRLR
ncbi:MAG: DUF1361 domain-containing protein [Chitinophagales bacterium]